MRNSSPFLLCAVFPQLYIISLLAQNLHPYSNFLENLRGENMDWGVLAVWVPPGGASSPSRASAAHRLRGLSLSEPLSNLASQALGGYENSRLSTVESPSDIRAPAPHSSSCRCLPKLLLGSVDIAVALAGASHPVADAPLGGGK